MSDSVKKKNENIHTKNHGWTKKVIEQIFNVNKRERKKRDRDNINGNHKTLSILSLVESPTS